MKFLVVLWVVMSSSLALAEDIGAITENGKQVILHENGKWKYAKIKKSNNVTDFRKTHWGMSKSDVKKTETGKIVRDDDILAYSSKVAGLDALIAYIFINDKLVRSKYVFIESHTNKNSYISDFNSIKKIITNKYNKPTEDKPYWSNDLYKDDYQSWGMAVAVGHLSYLTNWKIEDSDIWLTLTGDNYEITLSAEYSSVKLAGLEKSTSEKQVQGQF